MKKYLIYNKGLIEEADEFTYKNWLKTNWHHYNTGLQDVSCMNDKVSTGFIAHHQFVPQIKPFAVFYYRGGNINGRNVIKEYYASWEEALERHLQLVENGYFSLKQNAA